MRPEEIGKELVSLLPIEGVEHLQSDMVATEKLERMKKELGQRLETLFDTVEGLVADPDYDNLENIDRDIEVSMLGPSQEVASNYTRANGSRISQGDNLAEAAWRVREVARVSNFFLPVDGIILNRIVGKNISEQVGPVFEDITIGFVRQEVYKIEDGEEKLQENETWYDIEAITLLGTPDSGDDIRDVSKAFEDFIVIEETGDDLDIVSRFMAQEGSSEEWLIDLGYCVDDSDDKVAHAREESKRRRRKFAGEDILAAFDVGKLEAAVAIVQENLESFKARKLH
jgi:hypothetical protein